MSDLRRPASGPAAASPIADDGRALPKYDFRRPDRISKDQLRILRQLHDRFAQQASVSLAGYLRASAELAVTGVSQSTFGAWQNGLTDPTAVYSLALPPFDDQAALELGSTAAFALVDRLMGGTGRIAPPSRGLSELEFNVVDAVVRTFLQGLTEAWKPVVEITFGVRSRETQPAALQAGSPNDFVVVIAFQLAIGEGRYDLNLVLPVGIVEKAAAHSAQTKRRPVVTTQTEREWLHDNLGRVPMLASSSIETRISARDVLALQPGDIIALDVAVDEPIELRVAGLRKLAGRPVVRDQQALLQIVSAPRAGEPR